jgi:diguanylate cyclase (GGDEF)-like protein/PAS domain S-box-containing protein
VAKVLSVHCFSDRYRQGVGSYKYLCLFSFTLAFGSPSMPMKIPGFIRHSLRLEHSGRYAWLAVFVWTVTLSVSLGWNIHKEYKTVYQLALNTARANLLKDRAFRYWVSERGGVYVEHTDKVQPNPYLAHIPKRDIQTLDGKTLTLMNPASILRQMMEDYSDWYGIKGRIVGLQALNPNNLADPWEAAGIAAFNRGEVDEISIFSNIDGKPYLRLLGPLMVEAECLKCHGHLGYEIGKVHGAVQVAVPLDEYYQVAARNVQGVSLIHAGLWILGLGVIALMAHNARRRLRERSKFLEELALAAHVFEDSLHGILITDCDGEIVRVNRSFTEITGYNAAEVLGKTPRLLKSERHNIEFYQELWRALKKEGEWQGEFWNRRKDGSGFAVWESIASVYDNKGEAKYYIAMFQDITEKKRSLERIEHLASYDLLTDLPNRQLFKDRLEHAIMRSHRNDTMLAVIFIDLDHFKKVNDSLGHYSGDKLLCDVAKRLSGCLHEGDTVSRQGGDEFTVLIEDTAAFKVERIAEKLLEELTRPFTLGKSEVFIGASLGVALYPNDGRSADILLKNADTAMYRAKSAGRNRYQFFDHSMEIQAARRLAMETALRHALQRNELMLHYQPQVDVGTRTVSGVETLVRWRHPEHGLMPPGEFIPLAEETGLIVELGRWVLASACADAVTWLQAGRPLQVSVNVSAQQLAHPHCANEVRNILTRTGLPAHLLELEITESCLMENLHEVLPVLHDLKSTGIKLAIDDFGTGYSSLAYLKRLPLDRLKIDRSFVIDVPHNRDDSAIVRTIIAMTRHLGLGVIAEGVENEAQLNFLSAEGCLEIQGFVFAKPMPENCLHEALDQLHQRLNSDYLF